MGNDKKIGLKEIKEQYLVPLLAKLPYRFKIFLEEGAYRKTFRKQNLKIGTINALLKLEDSSLIVLGGGIEGVGLIVSLDFLIPIPDEAVESGEYPFVAELQESLSEAFSKIEQLTLTKNNKTYIGGVSGSYPYVGDIMQRHEIGKSVEFTINFEFSYLENAVNSSDVKFYLDDISEPLPVTTFAFNRQNNLTASLYSNAVNGEGQTYSENSTFGVDLALPAISPNTQLGEIIYNFVLGEENCNTPHKLTINVAGFEKQKMVIIGEADYTGSGVENASTKISFVPYVELEG